MKNTKTSIIYVFIATMHVLMVTLIVQNFINSEETIVVKADNPQTFEVEVEEKPDTPPTPREYIFEVFGEDAKKGIEMLEKCENKKLNPEAINWNSNGTWDFGLWQINEIHGYTQEELADPYFNTDVAYKIFENRGWSAWTCSYTIGVKSFWQ